VLQSITTDALSYYQAVMPQIVASFRGIPFAWNTYSPGAKTPTWRGPLASHPHRVPTVDVTSASGIVRPYFALEPFTLEWLAKEHGAIEFHSWTPTAQNPAALRYARMLLEPGSGTLAPDAMRQAALLARDILQQRKLDAIPLLDGYGGIALYIPFSDAPAYAPVRAWLHAFANDVAARHPNNFTTEPNSAAGTRVHVHVKSNAPGLHSALPYSLRGPDARYAVAPVTWGEIESLGAGELRFEATQVVHRARAGDLFATQSAAIGAQAFAAAAAHAAPQTMAPWTQPRGHVIRAAIEVLADGHARDAQAILHDAIARGLLTSATSEKYVYVALTEYIARSKGHDRKPPIVQDPDRSFRINEPLDDWPDVALPQAPPPDDATAALIARLRKTVSDEPTAWEVAVCDAFAHLGFRATHMGGHKAPDGTIDAQLGALGYRAMLECKSGRGVVTQPDAVEAAKWVGQFNAQYCTLVGPGFSEEVELHSELLTHKVSAWTIDDLVTALQQLLNPLELLPCFAPGFAEDSMVDVLWNREHGERKRVAYAARVIAEQGHAAQIAAAEQADPQNAAHLTIDAAMLLVQEKLTSAGAVRACTRDEIAAAFVHLTDPIVGNAVWLDDTRTAIVITRAND
jgi:bifunctional non-homologous end joining protein LigD